MLQGSGGGYRIFQDSDSGTLFQSVQQAPRAPDPQESCASGLVATQEDLSGSRKGLLQISRCLEFRLLKGRGSPCGLAVKPRGSDRAVETATGLAAVATRIVAERPVRVTRGLLKQVGIRLMNVQ